MSSRAAIDRSSDLGVTASYERWNYGDEATKSQGMAMLPLCAITEKLHYALVSLAGLSNQS